ncbi:unnamed protein product [Brassica rapa subsp. trilocularis]
MSSGFGLQEPVGTQFRGKYNNHQLGGPMAADRGPVPSPSQVGPGSGPPPRPHRYLQRWRRH